MKEYALLFDKKFVKEYRKLDNSLQIEGDKKIIKSPYYSIDRIGAKSDLATRGLHELGLLKDEKHFTIIYVCQFCGRLINYSSTPCIFCGG